MGAGTCLADRRIEEVVRALARVIRVLDDRARSRIRRIHEWLLVTEGPGETIARVPAAAVGAAGVFRRTIVVPETVLRQAMFIVASPVGTTATGAPGGIDHSRGAWAGHGSRRRRLSANDARAGRATRAPRSNQRDGDSPNEFPIHDFVFPPRDIRFPTRRDRRAFRDMRGAWSPSSFIGQTTVRMWKIVEKRSTRCSVKIHRACRIAATAINYLGNGV